LKEVFEGLIVAGCATVTIVELNPCGIALTLTKNLPDQLG